MDPSNFPTNSEYLRTIVTDEMEKSLSVLDTPVSTGRDYLMAQGAVNALKAILDRLDKETV